MELRLPELPRAARWFHKGYPPNSILDRDLERWRSMGTLQRVSRSARPNCRQSAPSAAQRGPRYADRRRAAGRWADRSYDRLAAAARASPAARGLDDRGGAY